MKFNKWTLALAAAGVVSLGSVAQAEEAQHQVMTALSSTTLSGYVDTSAIWKLGTDHGIQQLPGRTFDGAGRQDGFNLHAVKLTLEKPVGDGQWAAGYKADLVFGPDANYYQTGLNGGGTDTGALAVKQAYVALRAPVGTGLDLKIGVFDTIVGYEVFESGNNPNFSRSYGYALEPTQHTGVLASYNVTEWLGFSAGVANTWTGGINNRAVRAGGTVAETEKTYMASVTIKLPESLGPLAGSVIYGGVVDGLNGAPAGINSRDTTGFYAGATLKTPIEALNVGLAYDYRDDGVGVATPANNRAYAMAGYVSFAVSEKLKLNGRIDYVNAANGTFWAGPHASSSEKLLGNTLTIDYSLWDNVVTRLEARWDHSLNGNKPFGALPGDAEKNALSLAANIIYKF
jgi:hypothetical protein